VSVVNVMCSQIEVSATGRSLVQRNPTDCCNRVSSNSLEREKILTHVGLLCQKQANIWFIFLKRFFFLQPE
jgi:hypothetical protein